MKRYFRYYGLLFLRLLLGRIGGVLLSRSVHQQILTQRARALAELIAAEASELPAGLACIVFSRDRALQLHALLNTYFTRVKNPAPLHVIYKASTSAHQNAYEDIINIFSKPKYKIEFVSEENGFRQTLLSVLSQLKCATLMFLVDDIIFIRDVDFSIPNQIDPAATIFSLRHSPNLRRSYTANMDQRPPAFRDSLLSSNLIEFDWFEQGNEWSDPWSVDGHFLSLAEVKVISRISSFGAPNSYENCLKSFNDIIVHRNGMCFRESVILNLPINRVQTEIPNISGEVSADMLLQYWNQGLALDTSVFNGYIPRAPHEEHIVRFVARV